MLLFWRNSRHWPQVLIMQPVTKNYQYGSIFVSVSECFIVTDSEERTRFLKIQQLWNSGRFLFSVTHSQQPSDSCIEKHDDVIKWKHFPRYWPFVRGIHRSPVNSPYKGQWCGALTFSLICVWINGWVNHRKAGDLRRYRAHYDIIVMNRKLSCLNLMSVYHAAGSVIHIIKTIEHICLIASASRPFCFLPITMRRLEWLFFLNSWSHQT